MNSADTSELFFDDVKLPPENLLGTEEGQGFAQLMKDLPRERLIVVVHAQAMIERALALTIPYVKERKAFGKPIMEFQNTQFVLAECKSEATISRVFHDHCIERYLKGELDHSLYSILQILSVTTMEKTPLIQVLSQFDESEKMLDDGKQLILFN